LHVLFRVGRVAAITVRRTRAGLGGEPSVTASHCVEYADCRAIGLSRVFAQDDVIVEIAGQSITNIYDYTSALDLLKIGQPVKVIYTGAGKRVETR